MNGQTTISDFLKDTQSTDETPADNSGSDRYKDPDWLREQYVERERSTAEIGEECGVSGSAISYWLDKHDIETRSLSDARTSVPSELQDPDWLREQYIEKERSTVDIAEEFDVTAAAVSYRLRKHGIETRSISDANTSAPEELQDPDWLRDQYYDKGYTTVDIAESLDVSQATVWGWMEKHEIERRTLGTRSEGDTDRLRDSEWLREQYWEQGRSTIDIADELNVSTHAVTSWMDKHGISRRSLTEAFSDASKSDLEQLEDEQWLQEQYVKKERSSADIAKEIGVSSSTVLARLAKIGIERRSNTEAQDLVDHGLTDDRLADEEWLRKQYHEKKHSIPKIAEIVGAGTTTVERWFKIHDIERRSRLDAQAIALSRAESNPDNLDHLVRSSWELEIANLLNDFGIDYEYEGITICFGDDRTYTPDFVTDEYAIEIKGRVFQDGNEEKKARAAMKNLEDREYVVVGTKLPADHYISWHDRTDLVDLLEKPASS